MLSFLFENDCFTYHVFRRNFEDIRRPLNCH